MRTDRGLEEAKNLILALDPDWERVAGDGTFQVSSLCKPEDFSEVTTGQLIALTGSCSTTDADIREENEFRFIRAVACYLLSLRPNPLAEAAVQALIRCVDDPYWQVRCEAADGLGRLGWSDEAAARLDGPTRAAVIRSLERMLHLKGRTEEKLAAAGSLLDIGAPDAIEVLMDYGLGGLCSLELQDMHGDELTVGILQLLLIHGRPEFVPLLSAVLPKMDDSYLNRALGLLLGSQIPGVLNCLAELIGPEVEGVDVPKLVTLLRGFPSRERGLVRVCRALLMEYKLSREILLELVEILDGADPSMVLVAALTEILKNKTSDEEVERNVVRVLLRTVDSEGRSLIYEFLHQELGTDFKWIMVTILDVASSYVDGEVWWYLVGQAIRSGFEDVRAAGYRGLTQFAERAGREDRKQMMELLTDVLCGRGFEPDTMIDAPLVDAVVFMEEVIVPRDQYAAVILTAALVGLSDIAGCLVNKSQIERMLSDALGSERLADARWELIEALRMKYRQLLGGGSGPAAEDGASDQTDELPESAPSAQS
ncbi:MAG: hypothetical protein ABIJ46_02610 [bacterium]